MMYSFPNGQPSHSLAVIANAKTTQTMIAKDQNIALLTVGNSALKNADWTDYANYCFDREKGLRKEAFKHLDKFGIMDIFDANF